jgi:dihydropteroate synthase-like protein
VAEHILFLTGKLAGKSLKQVLESMQPAGFTYEIVNIGLSVAALMTAEMIQRRLHDPRGADRILVPGLCTGDLGIPARRLGVPIVRGPKDLKDLPTFFGQGGKPPDLSRYDIRIFAEIVEAPYMDVDAILHQASLYKADGADVIDVGCIPGVAFPHLHETVVALIEHGYQISIDSLEPEDLVCGGKAGAQYLLSLKESTLWVAEEVESTPVLIPEQPGDMASLYRAIEAMQRENRHFIADPILDPIHFGFTASIGRYQELRRRYPAIAIMMGTGNLSELTDADTAGMHALMAGIMSELRITYLLTTQVSLHARSAVRELDLARRIMFAAREDNRLPRGYDGSLMVTHERKPFPYTAQEIAETAAQIRDPSYRIQVSNTGLHVYNRDGMHTATDPFDLFPQLGLLQNDAPHAFYLGVELARAQIAWQLGKRYIQDEELDWGCAYRNPAPTDPGQLHAYKGEGTTLQAKKKKKPL